MALTIAAADDYVRGYCADNEDWLGLDAERKQTFVNIADRTLKRQYRAYVIPDDAVYDTACALSVAFNDVNRFARQGAKSVNSSGTAFTFDTVGNSDYARHIPQSARDLINDDPANAGKPTLTSRKRWRTTVIA